MPALDEVLTRLSKFRRINDLRVFIVEPNEQAFERRIQRGFKRLVSRQDYLNSGFMTCAS